MRYLRQQSVGEVASKTGMTPAAVRVALFRIRKVLMQCIDQQLAVLGVRTTRPAGGPARSSQ
jgi:DNA-directed RNA polymerase specialized sigma24 family protein